MLNMRACIRSEALCWRTIPEAVSQKAEQNEEEGQCNGWGHCHPLREFYWKTKSVWYLVDKLSIDQVYLKHVLCVMNFDLYL